MFGPQTMFILGAYAVAAGIVAVLILWVVLDYRAQRKSLVELEARRAKKN